MELIKKNNIITEMEETLKSHSKIDEINKEDSKASITLNAKYGKENDIKITFRKPNDMLILKASVILSLEEDDDIQIALNDILLLDESFNGNITSEKTCDLTKVVNFTDKNDKEAKKIINNEFNSFIALIDNNANRIICKEVTKQKDIEKKKTMHTDKIDTTIIENNKKTDNLDIETLMAAIENDEEEISKLHNKLNNSKKTKHYKVNMNSKSTNKENDKENVLINNEKTHNENTQKEDKDINNDMFADIEKVFEERRRQADQRENTLNEYAKRLKDKEVELELKQKEVEKEVIKKTVELESEYKKKEEQLKKEYITKETELDNVVEQIENEKNQILINKQKIDIEFKKLEIEKENIQRERDNLEEQKNLLGVNYIPNTNEEIEELNSLIKNLEEENSILKEEMDKVKSTSSKKDVVINKLKEKIDNLSYDINDDYEEGNSVSFEELENLKKELEQSNSKIKTLVKEKEDIASEKEKLNTDNSIKETEIEKYKEEINQLKESLNNLKTEIQDIKDGKLEDELKEEKNKNKALSIIDNINNIGIKLDIMPSASDNTILMGERDGVTYCVNVNANIIYSEKAIKQSKKYALNIEEWNQEDIRISYFIDSKFNKIICKYVYDDVLNAMMDIMNKFKEII